MSVSVAATFLWQPTFVARNAKHFLGILISFDIHHTLRFQVYALCVCVCLCKFIKQLTNGLQNKQRTMVKEL